jgi:hypothetical protein
MGPLERQCCGFQPVDLKLRTAPFSSPLFGLFLPVQSTTRLLRKVLERRVALNWELGQVIPVLVILRF